MSERILIVDDEENVCKLIEKFLRNEGYDCAHVGNGDEAVALCRKEQFDLAVLDVMLPGMDGFSTCRALRRFSNLPIIMLSARGEEYDRIKGLRAGADDYVSKPFSPQELMLRVNAVLRRTGGTAPEREVLVRNDLVIDLTARTVEVAGENVSLSPKEFDLLAALASRPDEAQSREQLMREVWGAQPGDNARTLDTHVKQLRKALGDCAECIQTVWGVGYRFHG